MLFRDLSSCGGNSVAMVGVGAEVVIVGTFVGPGEREVDGARSLECFWNLERNAGAIVRPVVDLYVSKCTSHGTAQNPTSPVPLIDPRPSLIRTEFVVFCCLSLYDGELPNIRTQYT